MNQTTKFALVNIGDVSNLTNYDHYNLSENLTSLTNITCSHAIANQTDLHCNITTTTMIGHGIHRQHLSNVSALFVLFTITFVFVYFALMIVWIVKFAQQTQRQNQRRSPRQHHQLVETTTFPYGAMLI